jgi:carbon monoxide dehydrogenase subunit G
VSGRTTSGNVVAKMNIEFLSTDDGTKIDYRLEVGFRGLMRLIEPFMKPALAKQYETVLDALNDYIAANQPT